MSTINPNETYAERGFVGPDTVVDPIKPESEHALRQALIARMKQQVPAGKADLTSDELAELRRGTVDLIATQNNAQREYERFLSIADRGLEISRDSLEDVHAGKVILVTGGTGCIGSSLLAELVKLAPARVVSVSRGVTPAWQAIDDVEYVHADIRDGDAIHAIMQRVKPDMVYHLAAQRDPALAETEVNHTISTNIFGTQQVVQAAHEMGVERFIYASTGKTLRPFSPDVYAASKKTGEWIVANAASAASSNMLCSGVRFTHVVDNSLIVRKIHDWAEGDTSSSVRLHGSDISFYGQSAREAAHLLMVASLGAQARTLNLHTIRDLALPINLLDLTLGVLKDKASATPVYFSGYDAGYEESPYPGLYDPLTAIDLSPLVSSFEADHTIESPHCAEVDVTQIKVPKEIAEDTAFIRLRNILGDDTDALRNALHNVCWSQFDARLATVPSKTLERIIKLSSRREADYTDEHHRIDAAIKRSLRARL